MSSRRRTVLLLAAATTTTGLLALGGALWHYTRPDVQRGLALDALHRAGWSGNIGGISVGLSGDFKINGLAIGDPRRETLHVAEAAGNLSLWDALGGELHIRELDASGIAFAGDKTKPATEKTASPDSHDTPGGKPFPRIRIDRANLAGTHALRPGENVSFGLRIRNLDTDSGGTVVFDIDRQDGRSLTGELRVKTAGSPVAGESLRAALDRLAPDFTLDAEIRAKGSVRPVATFAVAGDKSGATLAAKAGASKLDAKIVPAEAKLKITGSLALDDPTLNGLLAEPLPATGKATFGATSDPLTGKTDATLAASGSVPSGERFEIVANAGFLPGDGIVIRNMHTKLGDAAKPEIVVADLAGLTLRRTPCFRIEPSPDAVAVLRLSAFPLSRLNPFLGKKVSFPAGTADGDFRLARDASGTATLKTLKPLRLSGVAVGRPGAPTLGGIEATLPLEASLAADGALLATTKDASVRVRDAALFSGDLDWRSGADGAGALRLAATVSPAALPPAYLPGGVVEFCIHTGTSLAVNARISRDASGKLVADSAGIEAVTKDGVRALAVKLPRPFAFDAAAPADGKPVATFAFRGAPLGIFNPFLGGATLAGIAERGDFDLSRDKSGWRVTRSPGGEPASITGLSWKDASGTTWLNPTDARGSVAWRQNGPSWNLSLDDVTFSNASGTALTGSLEIFPPLFSSAGWPHKIKIRGELGALATSLPVVARTGITGGAYDFDGTRDPMDGTITFNAHIRKLMTSRAGPYDVTLGVLAGPDQAGFGQSSTCEITGPSGTTKARLSGGFKETASGSRDWDLKIAGDTLYADDWTGLFAKKPTTTPTPGKTASPAKAPEPDAAPFWAGETGKLTLAFDAVRFAGETFEKPAATLVAETKTLRVTAGTTWRGVTPDASGTLTFTPGTPAPYALKATAGAKAVDVDRLATAFTPAAKGVLDGAFDITATATGEAPTAGALAGAIRTDATMTGAGGILRFFKADNEVVRLSGDIAGIAGDIAGDLGRVIGTKAPRIGRALGSLSLLRTALGSFRYDKFTLTATRLPDGRISPVAAEIVNDTLRLRANGKIGPDTGAGFAARRATISGDIAGSGAVGLALGALPGGGAKDGDRIAGPSLRYDGPLNRFGENFLGDLFGGGSPPAGASPPEAPAKGVGDALMRAIEKVPEIPIPGF